MMAMETNETPSVISLSRQGTPTLDGSSPENVRRGGYVLTHVGAGTAPDLTLVASGTEVDLALQTAQALVGESQGPKCVRVVSLPCWELFDKQTHDYRLSVLPNDVPVMSIEASGVHGWSKYAHASHGMEGFGLSAPGGALMEHFGFTVPALVAKAHKVLSFYKGKQVVSPVDKAF
jgi:transketolase